MPHNLAPLHHRGRGLTQPREGAGPGGGGSAGTWKGRALPPRPRCAGGAGDVGTLGLA